MGREAKRQKNQNRTVVVQFSGFSRISFNSAKISFWFLLRLGKGGVEGGTWNGYTAAKLQIEGDHSHTYSLTPFEAFFSIPFVFFYNIPQIFCNIPQNL